MVAGARNAEQGKLSYEPLPRLGSAGPSLLRTLLTTAACFLVDTVGGLPRQNGDCVFSTTAVCTSPVRNREDFQAALPSSG